MTAALKRLTRKERALEWRRDHVLDSAERVFAKRGFHEATMQEIARDAEYATGTLYTLFDSKEALFGELVERRVPHIAESLRVAYATDDSPRGGIRAVVRAFFELFEARKPLFQIYVNISGGFLWSVKSELGADVQQHHLAFLAFLEDAIREAIRRGEVDQDVPTRMAAVSIVGTLTAAATDWITRSPDRPFTDLQQDTERVIDALLAPRNATRPSKRRKR